MPVPHHPIGEVDTSDRADCNGALVLITINFNAFTGRRRMNESRSFAASWPQR
jgi:hypothetical protein